MALLLQRQNVDLRDARGNLERCRNNTVTSIGSRLRQTRRHRKFTVSGVTRKGEGRTERTKPSETAEIGFRRRRPMTGERRTENGGETPIKTGSRHPIVPERRERADGDDAVDNSFSAEACRRQDGTRIDPSPVESRRATPRDGRRAPPRSPAPAAPLLGPYPSPPTAPMPAREKRRRRRRLPPALAAAHRWRASESS